MLVLVMSLLYWTQTDGGCSASVSITGNHMVLPLGEGFKLSCDFTCLGSQHVAQLWRKSGSEEHLLGVSLVNISSVFPSVSLVLNIRSATKADTGNYSCMTQPPDTISPQVWIQIANNLTMKSNQTTNNSHEPCSAAGECSQPCGATFQKVLQGQIWYWMLLGKTAILLLSLASLAVKYKRG